MRPSAIKTNCAGVVLMTATGEGESAVGSPPGAAGAGAVTALAEVSKDSTDAEGSLGGDFVAMFTSFEVVLIILASGIVGIGDT